MEFFIGGNGYLGSGGFSPEKMDGETNFVVDDLLDIPNDEASMAEDVLFSSGEVTSSNSSSSNGDTHFDGTAMARFDSELCVPYEEMAELEWLSNFVEESFCGGEEVRSVQVSGGAKGPARSKRSGGGGERRCMHCAAERTPQWRSGPMGPKTLCNACGVRYKSGRLVPEYRPAASPTFVSARHSNSHRKVLQLRRHKDDANLLAHTSLFNANAHAHTHAGDDYHLNAPHY